MFDKFIGTKTKYIIIYCYNTKIQKLQNSDLAYCPRKRTGAEIKT